MTAEPTLFEFETFEREAVAATPWTGAPLAYTTDYHDPADLIAAFERYTAEHGHFACIPRSHMWHPSITGRDDQPAIDGHELRLFQADARCEEKDHNHQAAPLPGQLLTQGVCGPCRWHSIDRSEQRIVEAWHDHAMPGWRDLPVMPDELARFDSPKHTAAAAAWIAETYPERWQRPGVPIRTTRAQHATRHVPGRSPLGGYDMAVTA